MESKTKTRTFIGNQKQHLLAKIIDHLERLRIERSKQQEASGLLQSLAHLKNNGLFKNGNVFQL